MVRSSLPLHRLSASRPARRAVPPLAVHGRRPRPGTAPLVAVRRLLAPSCALALMAALGACTGADEPAGVVPNGVPTTMGPVTLTLPEGFQVLEAPDTSEESDVFVASSDPKGAGPSPRISVLYDHERSGDVETYSEASKKLLGSGYGGHADIDRDEAAAVPGSDAGWALRFTRDYKNTPFREGWLFAQHGDGMVRVIVRASEASYDAAGFDAVLESVTLS